MVYKTCKLSRDRSEMKGILLLERNTFSAVSLLPFTEIS